jgi:hypothetical protein
MRVPILDVCNRGLLRTQLRAECRSLDDGCSRSGELRHPRHGFDQALHPGFAAVGADTRSAS